MSQGRSKGTEEERMDSERNLKGQGAGQMSCLYVEGSVQDKTNLLPAREPVYGAGTEEAGEIKGLKG